MAARQRRGSTARSSGSRKQEQGSLPRTIYAQASPRSIGGRSLFDATAAVTADTIAEYESEPEAESEAIIRLRDAGFQVLDVSPVTINIAGTASAYRKAFDTALFTEEREVIKGGARRDTATFIETEDTAMAGLIDSSKSGLADVLEGVAIERPVYPHAANAFAPTKSYWHLDVPGDVSLGVNAARAHRSRTTGRGVRLVMVDSGWYRHPYFEQRGYRADPVVLGPGATKPGADESGHGTGESANAFAVAPDIRFGMVKMNFANSTGSFNKAVALNPEIISSSWGSSIEFGPLSAADKALAAAIAQAVASGIVVVFSAGNGHWGYPGQHPDVISAGGVYLLADGSMRASNYASGFASNIYPGREVPDVSGLVGEVPRAAYIMLPVEPGDDIDKDLAGGTHPNADETGPNDGWAAFSGTSAAAPQVAGACALIKQAAPKLSPKEVRRILKRTARDVTAGTNAHGNQAKTGFDLATGAGLIDADRAVLLAKVKAQSQAYAVAAVPAPTARESELVAAGANGEPLQEEDVEAIEALIGESNTSLVT